MRNIFLTILFVLMSCDSGYYIVNETTDAGYADASDGLDGSTHEAGWTPDIIGLNRPDWILKSGEYGLSDGIVTGTASVTWKNFTSNKDSDVRISLPYLPDFTDGEWFAMTGPSWYVITGSQDGEWSPVLDGNGFMYFVSDIESGEFDKLKYGYGENMRIKVFFRYKAKSN